MRRVELVSLATLSVAAGATVAIFIVVNAVLLRPASMTLRCDQLLS